jgi:hypothetical protein
LLPTELTLSLGATLAAYLEPETTLSGRGIFLAETTLWAALCGSGMFLAERTVGGSGIFLAEITLFLSSLAAGTTVMVVVLVPLPLPPSYFASTFSVL